MFEVAAHCIDLVLEGCFFVHLVWGFLRPFVPKLRTGCIFAQDSLPQERDRLPQDRDSVFVPKLRTGCIFAQDMLPQGAPHRNAG
jgi:hypothetical protein